MTIPDDAWCDLQEAFAYVYLCMRAIDEIEDHPRLECAEKISLLRLVRKGSHMRPTY